MPILPPLFTPAIDTLFLDRDGTIMEDRDYLADPAGVVLLPAAGEALGRLCVAGVRLFLVTNQSGIGRGYFSEADLRRCQTRLDELLRPYDAHFEDTRFCPHAPEVDCACRKPRLGMWESLAKAHGLNPSHCAMVGDKPDDIRFGVEAGFAACFLVLTGKGQASASAWSTALPAGRTLAPLGVEPMLSAGWLTMLDGDLKPVMGGTTEQFPDDFGLEPTWPKSARHEKQTPLEPTSIKLWLARDLNAVADNILSS